MNSYLSDRGMKNIRKCNDSGVMIIDSCFNRNGENPVFSGGMTQILAY